MAAYLLLGGLFAVMWTDSVQGIIMVVGLGLLDPLFVAIPISFALIIIVSLLTKKPPEQHIKNAFTGIS